jgi:hypothetical protein
MSSEKRFDINIGWSTKKLQRNLKLFLFIQTWNFEFKFFGILKTYGRICYKQTF